MDDQSQARDPAGAPPGRATPDFSAEHQAALRGEPSYQAQPEATVGAADTQGYTPGLSRKVLFGLLGAVVLVFAAGSAWVGYEVATGSAIDRLGKSVTPADRAALPAPVAPGAAVAVTPSPAPLPEPSTSGLLPPELAAGPTAPPALPSAEELLAGPKKPDALLPAPAALTRDLPEWLVIEVGGAARTKPPVPAAAATPAPAQATVAQASGGSGDETAAPKAPPASRREAQERASSVFARCPKPGESGAVECRRAVCAGAARKQAVCSAYAG